MLDCLFLRVCCGRGRPMARIVNGALLPAVLLIACVMHTGLCAKPCLRLR